MWLSDRRKFLLLSCAALAGCGFTPVYGPQGTAQGLHGAIEVAAPDDRNSYNLVKRLEERLGQPKSPRYGLSYQLTLKEDELGITPTQETTRYNILGKADYVVIDLASGEALSSGSVDSFTSYAATGTTVETLTAQRDAYERLMVILSDQITAQLLATSSGWAE